MAYTDVTNPVIVNVTKLSNFTSETHLRRMAIVSNGNTSIAEGGYKSCNINTYGDIVTNGSVTQRQAINFFSNAGNSKELVFVEVGNGTLSEQVTHLKNFIVAQELKCFGFILPENWYQVSAVNKAVSATMAESTIIATTTEKMLTELTLSGFDNTLYPIEVSFDKDGKVEYNPYTGAFKQADGAVDSDFPVTATLTDKTKNAQIGQIKFNKTGGTEQSTAINYTTTYSSKDLSLVNFLMEYATLDSEVFFFLPSPKDEDPSISDSDSYYNDLKSVMTIKENTTNTAQSVTGAVVGVTASNLFDISDDVPASSLNYKKANISPFGYTATLKQTLIQTPMTFIDTLAGNNVILNGRMRDGKAWDYYYLWYLTKYRVEAKITQLLLTGQNNPVSAIRFNQNGIDTIYANIISVLNNCIAQGVLTTFAKEYDSATGEFKNEGDITMPSFYDYIASNPDDYANEILTGISCFLQIGKFVRQIQWNVSLGN